VPAKTAKAPAKKAKKAKLVKTTKKAKTAKTVKKAKTARLVPLGDRILVQQVRQDEVRASGLVIPDTAREKPQIGEVLAVGPGRLDDRGKRMPMDVKAGNRVLYAKYTGQEVPRGVLGAEDEEFLVLKESDILARLG
jgi:chaperonin GroES